MSVTRGLLLAALLVATACTGEPVPDFTGTKGKGGTCEMQADCSGCTDCRPEHAEVCVQGECWLGGEPDGAGEPIQASYLIVATLPSSLDPTTVGSAAIRIYFPNRQGGEVLTCAELLADPTGVDADTGLNLLRSLNPQLTLGATADQTAMGAGLVGAGDDRLILVRLHAERNGAGALLGVGCTENATIELGPACTASTDCAYPLQCESSGRCGPLKVQVDTAAP